MKILLVDDHEVVRLGLKTLLSRNPQFQVVAEASNASEALDRVARYKPDVVVMDIRLPGKSGIEATREIIKQDAKAVIVMCSALGQESLVMEAIEAGATDFIVKPFRGEDVLAVVKKVLGE